jgi:hypothetical protein
MAATVAAEVAVMCVRRAGEDEERGGEQARDASAGAGST